MRSIHPRLSLVIAFFISVLAIPAPAGQSAVPDTPVGKKYHTNYAVIHYSDTEELNRFTRNIGTGLSFLVYSPEKNPRLAAERVDNLVIRVMTILDTRMPSLQFSIRVFRDQEQLALAYRTRSRTLSAPLAFYDRDTATISVAADSVNENVLAHEITHAVLCAWFSVPPPARMQEILAQYVDKHLGDE